MHLLIKRFTYHTCKNMQPRATDVVRRQAIPRRTAMHGPSPRAGKGPPSIAAFASGFAIEEEDSGPDPNDWFENKDEHFNLSGDFEDV